MSAADRESALARRLRQLEEEERRLRQDMKLINRQLRRLERGAPDFSYPRPAAAPRAPAEVAVGASQEVSAPLRRLDPSKDKRFASYFSSGSFVATRPLVRERRVQRNKAIFLLMFAALMAYLVYHVIF